MDDFSEKEGVFVFKKLFISFLGILDRLLDSQKVKKLYSKVRQKCSTFVTVP
jgi:hypothetical protein